MSFYIENEVDYSFPFDYKKVAIEVMEYALDIESFPYECQISLTITNNEEIKKINSEFRNINKETDVLSFPNIDYETPGDYSVLEDDCLPDYIDLETNEIVLGDILISADRMEEQAIEYGHSIKREYAFLIAHSMLHLLGYDHMTDAEAKVMETKQENILSNLRITREA